MYENNIKREIFHGIKHKFEFTKNHFYPIIWDEYYGRQTNYNCQITI